MLKKNKLSLFLLAVVMMLTIYYVNMPNDKTPSTPVDGPQIEERYAPFAETRLTVLETRNGYILDLEVVMADGGKTLSEKEVALLGIQETTLLTEREVLTEAAIIQMGFEDALVVIADNKANISILTNEFTVQDYINVALSVQANFDKTYHVVVTPISIA